MQRTVINIVLVLIMNFSLCLNAYAESNVQDKQEKEIVSYDKDTIWNTLNENGCIQDLNNESVAIIHLPEGFLGMSEAEFHSATSEKSISAVMNDDGSATLLMTEEQCCDYYKELTGILNKAFIGILEDEKYSITGISYTNDFSAFNIEVEGAELNFYDSFSAGLLTAYGAFFRCTLGEDTTEDIVVNYLNSDKKIIKVIHSADIIPKETETK